MDSKPAPYNVLLIEEDPKQTEHYSDIIREVATCKVDVISRVDNFLEWVGQWNYHLVVIDCSGMAADAGLSLLEQIKRMSPVTSVIVISEQASVEEAVSAIRMGAEDYLKKPFNLESIKLAIKRGLDRKAILGEDSSASSFLNLLNSCQMISASLEQNRIFSIIQSYFTRELRGLHSAVYSLQGDDPIRVDESTGNDRAMQEILDIALQASNPLPRMREADEQFRFIERGQLSPAMFIFRFRCGGQSDYFCVCLSPESPKAIDAFESRIRMLRAQIEVTGRSIEQYQGVQHLVYVDDATGLYNTRYLNNILDREILQTQANGKSFAVLFIDCDRFKKINDTHGHLVGTKILYELGDHLRKYVRETDTVFRYGGDEFVAVLSSCDLITARSVAERIRSSVEQRSFLSSDGLNIRFTVSIGVALFPDHAKAKKEIIDAADSAMYEAKRSTRNSVRIAAVPVEESHG